MTYPYTHKCVNAVIETLYEMLGAGMYVWDTRAMIVMEARATKNASSGDNDGGGGGDDGDGGGSCDCGGDDDDEVLVVREDLEEKRHGTSVPVQQYKRNLFRMERAFVPYDQIRFIFELMPSIVLILWSFRRGFPKPVMKNILGQCR